MSRQRRRIGKTVHLAVSLRMGILQRYVFWELVRVFLVLVVALTVILVLVGVVSEASQNGLGPLQILEILPYILPSLMPFTIPATALLTACVVFGRMAGDQEVTAVKAAGINILTVLWPAFSLGAILSLSTLLLTDQFVPWARGQIERAVTLAMEDIFLDVLRSRNTFIDMERGLVITTMRVEGKKLIQPTFRYTPTGGNTTTIQAEEATLKFDIQNRQVLLQLYNCHVETPGSQTLWFERDLRPFPLPMKIEATPVRSISLKKLRGELDAIEQNSRGLQEQQIVSSLLALNRGDFDQIQGNSQQSYEFKHKQMWARHARLNTEYHNRLAMSCSCFIFVFLGSPFSILKGRRQFLTNFFLCFLPVLLLYYPVMMLMMTLSKERHVNPAWAMWVANGLLFFIGLVVLRKVLQN